MKNQIRGVFFVLLKIIKKKKKKRCYVYNIFITNHWWLVVIDSNLNLTLKLLFYPNNNYLLVRICYKNVVDIIFFKT